MGDHFMRYQLDVAADRDAVQRALTTEGGVNGWWTNRATMPEAPGGRLELTFPHVPRPFDLELAEASPAHVVWLAGSFRSGRARPSGGRSPTTRGRTGPAS
jgi:hypothetical protein